MSASYEEMHEQGEWNDARAHRRSGRSSRWNSDRDSESPGRYDSEGGEEQTEWVKQ